MLSLLVLFYAKPLQTTINIIRLVKMCMYYGKVKCEVHIGWRECQNLPTLSRRHVDETQLLSADDSCCDNSGATNMDVLISVNVLLGECGVTVVSCLDRFPRLSGQQNSIQKYYLLHFFWIPIYHNCFV